MLNSQSIIAQIDEEISRLQRARNLLSGVPVPKVGVGRPKGSATLRNNPIVKTRKPLSAEAKARIAAAQKERWAKAKKPATNVVPAKKSFRKAIASKTVAKKTARQQA